MKLVSLNERESFESLKASDFSRVVEDTDFRMDISKWVEGGQRGTITFTSDSQDVKVICVARNGKMTLKAYEVDAKRPFISLETTTIFEGSEERTFLHLRETVGTLYDGLTQFYDSCKDIFKRNGTALLAYPNELARQSKNYLKSVVDNMKMIFC